MDSGLCCVLAVILVCGLIWAWSDANGKKKERGRAAGAQVVVAGPPSLPDWPLAMSIEIAEEWIRAVGVAAQEAYEIGAEVPIDEVRGYLDRSGQIAQSITRKIHAIQASNGAQLERLPRKTQDYLHRDNEDLIRLSGTLDNLRDSLTDLIAGSGVDQSRKVHELENDVNALRQALQRFER